MIITTYKLLLVLKFEGWPLRKNNLKKKIPEEQSSDAQQTIRKKNMPRKSKEAKSRKRQIGAFIAIEILKIHQELPQKMKCENFAGFPSIYFATEMVRKVFVISLL